MSSIGTGTEVACRLQVAQTCYIVEFIVNPFDTGWDQVGWRAWIVGCGQWKDERSINRERAMCWTGNQSRG
jgi:hypothetical protein